MIERFLRFVNGSLLVCVCGSNISRFLNLCARHEIMFWKIQPDSPTQVSFYIRLQDLYELRPYLRKTKNENPHQKKDRLSDFLAEIPRKKTWNFCSFVCHGRSLGAQYENLEN